MWQHNYEPVGGSLGLSALAAAIPIFVLFYMLGVKRKPAWMAAMSALAAALIVALVGYRMPVSMAIISTLYGVAFGIFLDNQDFLVDHLVAKRGLTSDPYPFALGGGDLVANALRGDLPFELGK